VHIQPKYAMEFAEARRVIADHGWGRIVTVGPDGLRATYGFFLLEDSPEDQIVVAGHFARADPQCADVEAGVPALVIFEGPHGFVSASWYRPDMTNIPSTMNHISVHLRGVPEPIGDEAERFDILRRTLERHEAPLGESRWRLEGDGLATSQRIAAQTVSFRLRAEHVEAKAKLSQAMPLPVRERIVGNLDDASNPHHQPQLAALMRRLSLAEAEK
jgi:transcriptional regulator